MTFDEVLGMANQMLTDEELNSMLREKYPGPTGALRLAQNLVSIFGAEHPNGQTIRGPVRIVQGDPNAPALQVVGDPNANVPATNFGGGGGGGLAPDDVDFPVDPPPAALPNNFPVILYGVIQSGSGQNYTVRCWIVNPASGVPLGDFSCFQDQIDLAETIPAGTHCLVWCSVGNNLELTALRLTVPVFLE